MIEWVAVGAGALALGGGGWAYALMKRGKAHARWKLVLDEVARSLGGRASPGTMFDAPEFRAELDGTTVTLRLRDIHKSAEEGSAHAESKLPESAGMMRLYFGWDVPSAPTELVHVKDVPPIGGVEGAVIAKAEDAALAASFMERALIDLIDVRREANAHGLEVIVRGGYLTLVLHGIQETPHMLERMVIVSTRLSKLVQPGASEQAIDRPCTLCEAKGGGAWVRCARCEAPYHRACFEQAGSCLVERCGETRSSNP
jgi:hypothetical protein